MSNDAIKAKKIGYWVTTGILVFCMTGGIFELLALKMTTDGIMKLGYPSYIIPALGLGKVLAILAILWPGLPRLKEWAYAGIFFDLTGAAASCALSGGYGAYGFHVNAPLIITGFCVASWALRPESRVIGVLFPAKSGSLGMNTRAANIG